MKRVRSAVACAAACAWVATAFAGTAAGSADEYGLATVENVKITSHDGTVLDGWIASPTVPEGTKTPTILISSPYFDQPQIDQLALYRSPDSWLNTLPADAAGSFWDDDEKTISSRFLGVGFPHIRLIRKGYRLALFSVRGTGSSGGCFSFGGRAEQRDQKALVDWIAKQPWSDRRVGMGGLSYGSWTTWSAAVRRPKALKAIVTAGDLIDLYQFVHSPQGADSGNGEYIDAYAAQASAFSGALSLRPEFLSHSVCSDVAEIATREGPPIGGDRDRAFYEERSLWRRLPRVRAAVLDTSGYRDINGHQYQDSTIWGSLAERTPKVQVRGWWGHQFPPVADWQVMVMAWFDHFLMGAKTEPPTGVVHHLDQDGERYLSTRWSAGDKEVLHLSGAGLTPDRRTGLTSFRAAPVAPDQSHTERTWGASLAEDEGTKLTLCPEGEALGLSRVYTAAPVASRTLIAGNPFLALSLASDQPGGMVNAELWDLAPDFTCSGPHFRGARWIASGGADLSFLADPFRSTPFATDRATEVRVDLSDTTYSLAPGHRLAVVLSHGELYERVSTASFPTITIGTASGLVVPVAAGKLGGRAPSRDYPARPFTPKGYRD